MVQTVLWRAFVWAGLPVDKRPAASHVKGIPKIG